MSLDELKSFLYKGSSLDLIRSSDELLARVDANIGQLVQDGKGDDVLKEISSYGRSYLDFFANKQANVTLDSAMFALASCSKLRKSEQLSHSVYQTLFELSQTPFNLFAFAYYRKYLADLNKEAKIGAHSGRGLKKAINKWYNQYSSTELMFLLTAFKRSYYWSNKDLIKLYHVRPKSDAVNFVLNYVMFGLKKVKEDKFKSEQTLLEFVNDLEQLKTLKSGSQVADLIRKHKFTLSHLPSKQRNFKEIWPPLLEHMNTQEVCEHLHFLLKHNLITSDAENLITSKILNLDNPNLAKTHPIYPIIAVQICNQSNDSNLIKNFQQANLADNSNSSQQQQQPVRFNQLKDSFWNLFKHSVSNIKSTNSTHLIKSRIALVVDVNTHMRNDRIDGLHYLSPLDVASCILVTLYHLNETSSNCDTFASSDKINKFNLADKNVYPDLTTFDTVFRTFSSSEKNHGEQIFDYCQKNNQSYDVFVFLAANDSNLKTLINEIQTYRDKANKPNTKMVFLNLSARHLNEETQSVPNEKSQNLILDGWRFDYYFILDSFLNNKF